MTQEFVCVCARTRRLLSQEFAAQKAAKSNAAAKKLAEEQATQLEHAAAESQARAASIQKWIDAQAEAAANARAAAAAEAERFRARVTPKQALDALACKESSERKTVLQMLAEAIKSRDLETLEKALEVDAQQSAWYMHLLS